ncbi:ABC transporter permease [Deminuibacter soli]|uniref:ABC transporter permease n=1 Tax=Deminuibacter soli TaxID=2291815 RepID=A0A3E1NI35_9BACT|nr:ABC transporter permease [Deminuibacter soli]RFM27514.1 ABC transporter permease [Deminuibacter soli]
MFKNYFQVAFRNFRKGGLSSFINVASLSIGMSVAMLIALWLYDELTYNKQFKNYDRIAQVIQNVSNNGEVQTWWSVPYPLANELRTNYGADFKSLVMAVNWGDHMMTIGDKRLKATGGYFESEMPDMFTLDMLQGSRNALKDPSSILISASAARAFFNNENPVGKTLKIDQMPPVKVAGIYKDFAANSTFANLGFVASWKSWYHANNDLKDTEDPWRPNFVTLFAQVNDNVSFGAASLKIKDAKLKKVNEQLQKKKPALFLQPMSKWHLHSEFKEGVNIGGAIKYVRMFSAIGLFVLLLACINFMNLSTARSQRRAREVGVRKTMGSLRSQLILQFFSESALMAAMAFVISLLIVWLSLPFFNRVAEKQMHLPFTNAWCWLAAIVFVLVTALLAGSYPALYLSSFKPVKVLKGTFKAGRLAAIPRKILVAVQFTVSVCLIICTITVYRQIQYAKNRPVGYSRANLLTIPLASGKVHDHFEAVKAELLQTGTVAAVAESESPTTGIWNSTSGFSWPGKDPNLSTDFGVMTSSLDFGSTVNWQLQAGRSFSRDFPTDSSAVILNEAAVKYMNLSKPLNQFITWWGKPLKVIGVVKNMVLESPYGEAKPVVYTLLNYPGNVAILRLKPGAAASEAIAKIEPVIKKYSPDQLFEYKFVDDEYARKFGDEERIGKLAGIFTLLAVLISCLGVFGLTTFVAEQRKKEIGVRKVLGASILDVWNLLSKEFVVLVAAAFVIAGPLAAWFMHDWLQQYTYRASLSWWIFAAAGAGALCIIIITVSFQAIKAAVANPVKSLRTE